MEEACWVAGRGERGGGGVMRAVVPTRTRAHSSGHGQRGAPAGASLGTWCPFPPHLPSAPHQRLGLQEPAWHQAGWTEDSGDGQGGGTLQPLRSHTPGSQGTPLTPAPGLSLFSDPAGSSLVALASPSPLTTDLTLSLSGPHVDFWPRQGCYPSLGSCSSQQPGWEVPPTPPSPHRQLFSPGLVGTGPHSLSPVGPSLTPWA